MGEEIINGIPRAVYLDPPPKKVKSLVDPAITG